jgi:energy-converting hydrogenase B subunit D
VIPLQLVSIVLVGALALAVVTTRDPLRQVIMVGFYSLLEIVLFVILQAPDVALSELVASTVAFPFILLAALARMRNRE